MGLHSLADGCLAWGDPALGLMVGLMVNSKRVYAKGDFPSLMLPVPQPRGEPLPVHASTGDPPTLAGSFGSVSCGVTAPLLWVLLRARFCLCPPRLESVFPPVLWKSYNQIPLAFKARFPGDPQAGKPDMGFRTYTTMGELLWYYFSPICGSPTDGVWDMILSWLGPSYHLAAASSLSLDVQYLFLVGSSTLLSVVVQQVVALSSCSNF